MIGILMAIFLVACFIAVITSIAGLVSALLVVVGAVSLTAYIFVMVAFLSQGR